MRYEVSLDGSGGRSAAPIVIELSELAGGGFEARVNGRPVEIDVAAFGTQPGRHVSVRVAGQMIDLTTEGAPPEFFAVAEGHRARVRVESERWRSTGPVRAPTAGSATLVVKSPMPGRVVKVLVSVGDHVRAGQGLVVLEAMKMENEVCAGEARTVAAVHVVSGAAVEGGARLVTLT